MSQSLFKFLSLVALLPISALSSPVQQGHVSLPLPSKTLFQFGSDTWIENVAVRSNNDLLLTLLSTPDLYTLTPSSPAPAKLLHTFTNSTGLLGITETTPDTFVLIAGNFTLATTTSTPHSYSLHSVSFPPSGPLSIKLLSALPEALFLNGITTLPWSPTVVLIADSLLGAVWRYDTQSLKYSIAIQIPEMAPNPHGSIDIGINGLHICGSHLYFTNSFNGLYRIAITPAGATVPGAKAELLGTAGFMDDFAIDERGNAWVMTNTLDSVVVFAADGREETVLGTNSSLTVAGDTAGVFGRGEVGGGRLYVVTGGGLAAPVNGTVVEGAKVVEVNVGGFWI